MDLTFQFPDVPESPLLVDWVRHLVGNVTDWEFSAGSIVRAPPSWRPHGEWNNWAKLNAEDLKIKSRLFVSYLGHLMELS